MACLVVYRQRFWRVQNVPVRCRRVARAMYVQASGRLKADAVCTILKAPLAIRPDG